MKGGTRTKSAISAIGILALSALFSIDALTCTRLPMIRSLPSTQLAITTSEQQQHEFELKVGKALDTLRTDYPDMLTKSPDYSIYSNHLTVVDPSGVTLHGIESYKNAFRLVHLLVDVFYCKERSYLTFRMVYDATRTNIRICWNAHLTPRLFVGLPVHVDGISVYHFDKQTGDIVKHQVEHLLINDVPLETRDGIFNAMKQEMNLGGGSSIPALNAKWKLTTNAVGVVGPNNNNYNKMMVMKFQSNTIFRQRPSLFSTNNGKTNTPQSLAAVSNDNTSNSNNYEDLDWEAYELKNKSRQKFGLKKLTPQEFKDLEAQVQQMDSIERSKYAAAQQMDATQVPTKKSESIFLLFGGIIARYM